MTDGAVVNFGRRSGALTQWLEWVGRFLLLIHGMNHRLELAMKVSLKRIDVFTQIKEMLGQLFRMFKNSGKLWRVFRVIAETMGVLITRFVKADVTRFQQHVYDAINSFTRNFLVLLLFAENAMETRRLLTNGMERRLTEYHKKSVTYEYVASCHLLRLVLSETRILANLLQTDELMVYEIYDRIVTTKDNLTELTLRSDEEELPFQNVEFDRVKDECKIKVSAGTRKVAATDKERALTEREHHEAEGNINVIHETFTLKNVCTGKVKVKDLRKNLLGDLMGKKQRWNYLKQCKYLIRRIGQLRMTKTSDHMIASHFLLSIQNLVIY